MDSNDSFLIISLNINHTIQQSSVIDLLKNESPHILFLQECPLNTLQLNTIVHNLGYTAHSSLNMDTPVPKPGVAVIYLKTLVINEILILEPGRLLLLETEEWAFINIYAPSGNNNKNNRHKMYNETLPRNLISRKVMPILIGDFNSVISELDCEEHFHNKKSKALEDLVKTFNYHDIFRVMHGNKREFTYFSPNSSPSRLDRAYLPERALNTVQSFCYKQTTSDHKSINIRFKGHMPPPPIRTKTFWKLNTRALKHEDFMINFEDCYNDLLQYESDYDSVELWWEEIAKPEIIKFLKKFSHMISQSIKNHKRYLYHLLQTYTEKNNYTGVKKIREKLSVLITESCYGYTLINKNKNAEEEKASLYHINKSLSNSNKTEIKKLKIRGIEIEDTEQIETEIKEYFSALFNGHHRSDLAGGPPVDTGAPFIPDYTDLEEILEGVGELEPVEAEGLEGDITLDEYFQALEQVSKNKSPGPDGIPYEFYCKVKHIIGPKMVQIINSQLKNGSFIKSQRGGITKLIPKTNDIPSVTDLRPIALLNCDYKITSKILTNRISGVLDSVLKSRQLAMNNDSNILFGISDIISTLSYVNQKKINAYLVSYDIYKAFDKTNISFVLKVMKKMKFGKKFCSWIENIHKNLFTSFLFNGITNPIDILFSIRQGDAISMILFLINIEPLLLRIHEALKGVKVGIVVQREEGYVDDISGLSTNIKDLITLDNLFTKFESISGTVLNRFNKCKIMGIGGWRGRREWPLPFLQPVDHIKIYGIHFCPTVELITDLSWKECKNKFNNCLNSWNSRALPFLSQKAFILQTFATSKLWYLGQVLKIPSAVVKEFEKRIGAFLWHGRLERLPLKVLYNPVKKGGLAITNIQAKCDALFLKHLTKILCTESPTRNHLLYWVGLSLRNMFPELVPPMRAEALPPYFLHCVRLLKENGVTPQIEFENLTQQTTKKLYGAFNPAPPPPRILEKRNLTWDRVWTRLNNPILSRESLDICFTVLHDIYPTKVRINRCRQESTGFCQKCPQTLETSIHFFAECESIIHLWIYTKNLLLRNSITNQILVDDELCLFFDLEVEQEKLKPYLFIISNYILFVHKNRNLSPTVNQLKSFFKNKKISDLNINI